jgi:hypothetical protein
MLEASDLYRLVPLRLLLYLVVVLFRRLLVLVRLHLLVPCLHLLHLLPSLLTYLHLKYLHLLIRLRHQLVAE